MRVFRPVFAAYQSFPQEFEFGSYGLSPVSLMIWGGPTFRDNLRKLFTKCLYLLCNAMCVGVGGKGVGGLTCVGSAVLQVLVQTNRAAAARGSLAQM